METRTRNQKRLFALISGLTLSLLASCQIPTLPHHYINETINSGPVSYTLLTQEAVDFQNNFDAYLISVKPIVTYGQSHGFFHSTFSSFHHH